MNKTIIPSRESGTQFLERLRPEGAVVVELASARREVVPFGDGLGQLEEVAKADAVVVGADAVGVRKEDVEGAIVAPALEVADIPEGRAGQLLAELLHALFEDTVGRVGCFAVGCLLRLQFGLADVADAGVETFMLVEAPPDQLTGRDLQLVEPEGLVINPRRTDLDHTMPILVGFTAEVGLNLNVVASALDECLDLMPGAE